MSLGTGALALIGGTVVSVGFLALSAGALVAVQGYNLLAGVGVEALTGFISAYLNVRIIAPLNAGIGLAATIGAGATAQLGAMRISEEIDALEVMGIRSIAYLASTRVIAGVLVVIPLYCVAVLMSFVVDGDSGRGHRRFGPHDRGILQRIVLLVRSGDTEIGQVGPRHGARRQGEAAWRRSRPGRHHRWRQPTRHPEAGARSRSGQV